MRTDRESRLKSRTESLVVDKFPLRREAASRSAFARNCLAGSLAIDFRPEESRSIMSSRVRLEADADIPLHPDGAILYRENSSWSVVPRPHHAAYSSIYQNYSSPRHSTVLSWLSSRPFPCYDIATTRVVSTGNKPPSRIKSVPAN